MDHAGAWLTQDVREWAKADLSSFTWVNLCPNSGLEHSLMASWAGGIVNALWMIFERYNEARSAQEKSYLIVFTIRPTKGQG